VARLEHVEANLGALRLVFTGIGIAEVALGIALWVWGRAVAEQTSGRRGDVARFIGRVALVAGIVALLTRLTAWIEAAPADLAEQLAVLTGGGRTVLETGDFSVFESPDFNAAVTAADSWVFENCAFVTTTEIVATEYQYEVQADTYPTGRTAFAVVNEGVEAHELAILRKNDGVDLTLDELLELPEAEAEQMVTYVGATFVGPPGARSNLVVDLEPGDYLAVCNVPAGTMVAEDGSFVEGTGQPHVMLGMSFEFAVE
jgi:hypothetical protein